MSTLRSLHSARAAAVRHHGPQSPEAMRAKADLQLALAEKHREIADHLTASALGQSR